MLFTVYEQDSSDKVGNELLLYLKGILAGQDMSIELQGQRVNWSNKSHLTELQFRKRLGWVKNKGVVLAQPIQIIDVLCEHWSGITQPRGDLLDSCVNYLGNAVHAVHTQCACGAKFCMSANT